MSGHSKWSNIKHKKARVDAKRGRIFSRLGREVMMAARHGGGNPDVNIRLRLAIERAREHNLPQDNITRAIQRGTGEVEGAQYEEILYEGYGPGGVAIMIELVTDNRNRTAADIRHIFSRHGGSLGETGCVAWMFERRGVLTIPAGDSSEDDLMMVALEAGADDIKSEGDEFSVHSAPDRVAAVAEAFASQGISGEIEIAYVPTALQPVAGDAAAGVLKLLEALEDHDDVQNVFANLDIDDEELARLGE